MGIELELPCRNEKGTFLVQVSRQDGQKTELQEIITRRFYYEQEDS